jgi:2-keto-4-pentenoate hydratase
VIGAPTGGDWRALDLRALQVHARVIGTNVGDTNGLRSERHGDGSAALGDTRIALAWLANELRSLGIALRAGDVVSTGTCMVPLEVQPADTVHADFGALGKLTVHLRD